MLDHHLDPAAGEVAPRRGDAGGAGAGTTGQRQPGAALPDTQAEPVLAHHLSHADVGALGKERIVLELGPELLELYRRAVVDEEGGGRVAQARADRVLQPPEPDR